LVAVCSFFFQAEDGIRDDLVTGVQTCALPISEHLPRRRGRGGALHDRGERAVLRLRGRPQVPEPYRSGRPPQPAGALARGRPARSEERRVGTEWSFGGCL